MLSELPSVLHFIPALLSCVMYRFAVMSSVRAAERSGRPAVRILHAVAGVAGFAATTTLLLMTMAAGDPAQWFAFAALGWCLLTTEVVRPVVSER